MNAMSMEDQEKKDDGYQVMGLRMRNGRIARATISASWDGHIKERDYGCEDADERSKCSYKTIVHCKYGRCADWTYTMIQKLGPSRRVTMRKGNKPDEDVLTTR